MTKEDKKIYNYLVSKKMTFCFLPNGQLVTLQGLKIKRGNIQKDVMQDYD